MEYLCGAQGLEFRRPLRPGVGPRVAHRVIRSSVPKLTEDRTQAPDIERVAAMMSSREIAAAVEAKVGKLA